MSKLKKTGSGQASRILRLSVVFKILGLLLVLEAIMLLLPMFTAVGLQEQEWKAFLITFGCTGAAGGLLTFIFRNTTPKINSREGFILTALTWVFYALFGMMPFLLCSTPLRLSDAFFESMSGFTTTGATVIADVEACSHSLLLWRSMMQWIGGLGIILFILAVLPSLDQSGGISMLNAEVSGISYGKLHPRIRKTAASLWRVYLVLTLALIILLWVGPLNLFESVCQAFSTMATGGFSTNNDSIGGFGSTYVGVVIIIFMFLGGVNIALLYSFAHGDWKSLLRNNVFQAYCALIGGTYFLVVIYMLVNGEGGGAEDWIINPLFHILSAVTTTGFTYHGFSQWYGFGVMSTLVLMFIGACAGSTSGASKVDRFVILFRHLRNEVVLTLHPNHLKRVTLNGNILPTARISRVVAFLSIEICMTAACTIFLTFYDISFSDAIFATVSALFNSGLGYGLTSPTFHPLPDAVKWMLSFCMLVGRLEVFTVLVIFTKSFWSRH